MEIKTGEAISHELAKILRARTTVKQRDYFAESWDVHANTIKNRIKMNNRTTIKNDQDKSMILELCKLAFQNNNKTLDLSNYYKLELENLKLWKK